MHLLRIAGRQRTTGALPHAAGGNPGGRPPSGEIWLWHRGAARRRGLRHHHHRHGGHRPSDQGRDTAGRDAEFGERPERELAAWREAGADRYLLRFETSDRRLFDEIHPPLGNRKCDRLAILRRLQSLGYETGSGIMVGIPGQTYASVADDIALFRELDLDMIGIGPFIPHPNTPLGIGFKTFPTPAREQVPNNELMVYKAVALTRLVRPDANIPATTALATINKTNGRELGLQRGANVFMPNLTPLKYRRLYEIYPAKACITETDVKCNGCLSARIRAIGRHIGQGQGGRWNRQPASQPAVPECELCHA